MLLCNHEDLLALWVSFKAKAMQRLTSCTLSMFQSVSILWTNGKIILCFIFAVYLHELSTWPQQYENDSTTWSFQTLAFATIWNCWTRAPVLKCSDTLCLFSSIKTSKNIWISETCTTCNSLRRLTFHDSGPGPRWNHRSSTYLSNILAPNRIVPNSVLIRNSAIDV